MRLTGGISELIVGAGCYLRVVISDVSHSILLLLMQTALIGFLVLGRCVNAAG